MKMLHTRLITAVLISVTGSFAAAQDMTNGKMDMGNMDMGMMRGCMQPMQNMQRMDANEDGEISKDEFIRAHEEMFSAMDQDGDGALDTKNGEMMMNCCHGESKDQPAMEEQ